MSPTMSPSQLAGIRVEDAWDAIPADQREAILARRTEASDWRAYGRQDTDSGRWEPLRPVVLREQSYRSLESIVGRVLELAVQSCRRRASTLGELRQALRFPHELPLMDPDAPLVTADLIRSSRPDVLVERGRPRILEFNIGTRLGGGTVTPRLAEGFAQLCPEAGLYPPMSVVTARTGAMLRALGLPISPEHPRRLLVPAYWTEAEDGSGHRTHNTKVKRLLLAELVRVGFEVVRTDLAELRLDDRDRLVADGGPVDMVMVPWGCAELNRLVDGGDGLATLRAADRAGTITLFPRTESVLVSSKAVLGWLHEDRDAGLLSPADGDLVRDHVPHTTVVGLGGPGEAAVRTADRDRLVVKPAMGKSGHGVRFGSQSSPDEWTAAVFDAARQAPVVLQQKVEPDCIDMPFLDRDTGRRVTSRVSYVVSPYMINGAASDVGVRHMGPDTEGRDVVISVNRGARSNAVVLADHPGRPATGRPATG
jgi:hypothetical protein